MWRLGYIGSLEEGQAGDEWKNLWAGIPVRKCPVRREMQRLGHNCWEEVEGFGGCRSPRSNLVTLTKGQEERWNYMICVKQSTGTVTSVVQQYGRSFLDIALHTG